MRAVLVFPLPRMRYDDLPTDHQICCRLRTTATALRHRRSPLAGSAAHARGALAKGSRVGLWINKPRDADTNTATRFSPSCCRQRQQASFRSFFWMELHGRDPEREHWCICGHRRRLNNGIIVAAHRSRPLSPHQRERIKSLSVRQQRSAVPTNSLRSRSSRSSLMLASRSLQVELTLLLIVVHQFYH
jgi:hypothetical protein